LDENHLATYGRWDLSDFSRQLAGVEVAAMIVAVRDAPGRRLAPERAGGLVSELWSLLRASLPSAVGHRASWRELWFFRPVADGPMELAATTCSASVQDDDADVWVAVAPVSASPERRLVALNELSMGLAKIEYRRQYPSALCVRNGAVEHRPG